MRAEPRDADHDHGQNGTQIKQSTKIAVTGSPKTKKKPTHKKAKGKKK